MSERYILLLDSSTEACSVALASSTRGIIADLEEHDRTRQSERLAVMANKVLGELPSGAKLSAICVAEGPGSYTGLRISAGYAKGLAFSQSIPLLSCSTTELMVCSYLAQTSVREDSTILMPMIDARRMEVYSALYTQEVEPLTGIAALILTDDSFRGELSELVGDKRLVYFGSGAEKAQTILSEILPTCKYVPDVHPHAKDMFSLALNRLESGKIQDVAYWEPFYLKEYQAQKSLNKVLNQ